MATTTLDQTVQPSKFPTVSDRSEATANTVAHPDSASGTAERNVEVENHGSTVDLESFTENSSAFRSRGGRSPRRVAAMIVAILVLVNLLMVSFTLGRRHLIPRARATPSVDDSKLTDTHIEPSRLGGSADPRLTERQPEAKLVQWLSEENLVQSNVLGELKKRLDQARMEASSAAETFFVVSSAQPGGALSEQYRQLQLLYKACEYLVHSAASHIEKHEGGIEVLKTLILLHDIYRKDSLLDMCASARKQLMIETEVSFGSLLDVLKRRSNHVSSLIAANPSICISSGQDCVYDTGESEYVNTIQTAVGKAKSAQVLRDIERALQEPVLSSLKSKLDRLSEANMALEPIIHTFIEGYKLCASLDSMYINLAQVEQTEVIHQTAQAQLQDILTQTQRSLILMDRGVPTPVLLQPESEVAALREAVEHAHRSLQNAIFQKAQVTKTAKVATQAETLLKQIIPGRTEALNSAMAESEVQANTNLAYRAAIDVLTQATVRAEECIKGVLSTAARTADKLQSIEAPGTSVLHLPRAIEQLKILAQKLPKTESESAGAFVSDTENTAGEPWTSPKNGLDSDASPIEIMLDVANYRAVQEEQANRLANLFQELKNEVASRSSQSAKIIRQGQDKHTAHVSEVISGNEESRHSHG